eukprot:15446691-Alexandrium_andersonii.AAC.1
MGLPSVDTHQPATNVESMDWDSSRGVRAGRSATVGHGQEPCFSQGHAHDAGALSTNACVPGGAGVWAQSGHRTGAGRSLIVDDWLLEGESSMNMVNRYLDPGREFALEMGCRITED